MVPPTRRCLRDPLVAFQVHMMQLTPYHLLSGYYPRHSLAVAAGTFLVAFSLAIAPSCTAGGVLFSSGAGLAAWTLLVTMTITALFRLMGGTIPNIRANQQAEWLIDVILKGCISSAIKVLLDGDSRARLALVAAVAIVGEVGALMSFWWFLTCAASLWSAYLLLAPHIPPLVMKPWACGAQ